VDSLRGQPLGLVWKRVPWHASEGRMASVLSHTLRTIVAGPNALNHLSSVTWPVAFDAGKKVVANGLLICRFGNVLPHLPVSVSKDR
jgi:hypothetical protein